SSGSDSTIPKGGGTNSRWCSLASGLRCGPVGDGSTPRMSLAERISEGNSHGRSLPSELPGRYLSTRKRKATTYRNEKDSFKIGQLFPISPTGTKWTTYS